MKWRWWYALLLIAVIVAVVIAAGRVGGSYLARERARAAEAQKLTDQGNLVAAQGERDALKREAGDLRRKLGDLDTALKRAEADARGARVVATRYYAAWARASGKPRPSVPGAPQACPGPLPGPSEPPAAGPAVLLAEGDRVKVEVGTVELETKKGNTVVTGAVNVFRLDSPDHLELIIHQAFDAKLSKAINQAAPRPRGEGWAGGLGAGLLLMPGRVPTYLVGGSVSPPPVDFLGLRWEALGGVKGSPSGEWLATVDVLGRR